MCANEDMLCIYMTYMHSMSSFAHTLVGSSSSGIVEVWREEGLRTHSKLLYEIYQCIIELIFHKLPLEESVLD